jgi:DNA-binding NarL/FixJ family response regulator
MMKAMLSPQFSPARILLIDDRPLARAGLRLLIENYPSLRVIGEAGNRNEALTIVVREQPDVIVIDLDMDPERGLNLIPEILAVAEQSRILVLTSLQDPEIQGRAARQGATGVVTKKHDVSTLITALEKVYAGEAWLDRSTTASAIIKMSREIAANKKDPEASKIATLSEREREVITLIGEGLKNRQIAERLFISQATVRHHLTSIFNKLCMSDRFELIIYAYKHGLAHPPE